MKNSLTHALDGAVARLAQIAPAFARPCAAVVLKDGRTLIASDPSRSGSLGLTVREAFAALQSSWPPGDLAICNDPFHGGVHVGEFTLMGAFSGGAVALRMRWPDVGGFEFGALAPQSFDTWGEGARFPPLLVRVGARPRREALELLALNTRTPRLFHALIQAMAAEADHLMSELREIPAAVANLDRQSAMAVAALQHLLDGDYSSEVVVCGPGIADRPTVRIDARISGGCVAFDFRRSDRQVASPLNSTPAHTLDCCLGALLDTIPALKALPAAVVRPEVDAGRGLVTSASVPVTTGLSPYLTARAIRRGLEEILMAAGAAQAGQELWWHREGARRFAEEVDPQTLRLHPLRVAEALTMEQSIPESAV